MISHNMAVTRIALFIIFILSALAQDSFTPQITVQAFKPKGFRIYLPGDAKIKFLRIQVQLNSTVHKNRLDEFVFHETKGYWVFEKPDIKLRIDDIIRYDIFFCTKNSFIDDPSGDSNSQFFCNGYVKADTFNVTNLDERNELPPVYNRQCLSEFRLTKVPNGEVCSGDVLLEEHFDDLLNPELWEVQHYIPMDHPVSKYCADPGFRRNVLSFGFEEIQLEPRFNEYGSRRYASGLLKIALVKGNVEYAKKLMAGPVMSDFEPYRSMYLKEKVGYENWNKAYHNYTLVWTPDAIEMYVDGEKYGEVDPGEGFYQEAVKHHVRAASRWLKGSAMAPFDELFYISLGLRVGGINEFPDATNKPWKNRSAKAALQFWNHRDEWLPTWFSDTSPLSIDSVRVYAL